MRKRTVVITGTRAGGQRGGCTRRGKSRWLEEKVAVTEEDWRSDVNGWITSRERRQ
uniref:Pentatricopeptide repeat-containing protein At5g42310-like n=1 Tax=Rhizophora mucronata TaxID=61149 RepID=A0A2P2JW45_RHIMU